MKDWLYPGAKVVCVDDIGSATGTPLGYLKRGEIYTVRYVVVGWPHWASSGSSEIGVYLDEVDRPKFDGLEHPFGILRFRPLTKRSTDTQVEKLKRFLTHIPTTADEDA